MQAPTKVFSMGRFDAWSDAVSAGSDNVLTAGEPDITPVGKGSFDAGTRLTRDSATVLTGGIEKAASREASRFRVTQVSTRSQRSWGARHPALLGALIGFGSGCRIGYMGGDDGVFDDFTAGFNGWVMGGIGACVGATIGAIVATVSD
jgi:hypothetical protein